METVLAVKVFLSHLWLMTARLSKQLWKKCGQRASSSYACSMFSRLFGAGSGKQSMVWTKIPVSCLWETFNCLCAVPVLKKCHICMTLTWTVSCGTSIHSGRIMCRVIGRGDSCGVWPGETVQWWATPQTITVSPLSAFSRTSSLVGARRTMSSHWWTSPAQSWKTTTVIVFVRSRRPEFTNLVCYWKVNYVKLPIWIFLVSLPLTRTLFLCQVSRVCPLVSRFTMWSTQSLALAPVLLLRLDGFVSTRLGSGNWQVV